MTDSLQKVLSRAVASLLRPLVRILLRNGIAYGSFAELAKRVYVDVAFEEFAPEGKKQTVTHASALTGLTRKDVKRLLDLKDDPQSDSEQRYNRAVRVISGWVNDHEFHTATGRPATLPMDGDQGSFSALVRKYSGDVTTQSMLAVLEAASSISRNGDRIRLIKKAYVPGNDPVDKLDILGTDTAELIATIDHNLTHRSDDLRYQRKVSNHQVDPRCVNEFIEISSEKSQALLEELDAWLSQHEVSGGEQSPEKGRYLSLGIYFYEQSHDREGES
jgi:hypothetical protein